MSRQTNHLAQMARDDSPLVTAGRANRSWWRRVDVWCPVVALSLVAIALLLLLPLVLGNLQQQEEGQTTGTVGGQPAPGSQPARASLAEMFPDVARNSDGRLRWPRPRCAERQSERDRLVDRYIARSGPFSDAVRDDRVLAAMRAVPRHEFVSANRQDSA
jgi:hypothetical protein